MDPETLARQVNAEPWDPLPGMVKLKCVECEFWYAEPDPRVRVPFCQDCKHLKRRGLSYRSQRSRPRSDSTDAK